MLIDRRMVAHFDWPLFWSTLLLPILGIVVLYSAGYDPANPVEVTSWLSVDSVAAVRQTAYLGMGLIVMLIGILIPTASLHRYSYFFYVVCLGLLVSVLLFGEISHGSRRWLTIGSFNFQPSELMKIALILALARYLSKAPPPPGGYGFKGLLVPFAIILIPMGLIVRQPDLGTALAVGAGGFLMVLFMGIRWRSLAYMLSAGALALYPLWLSLHDYQKRRVFALINPDADPKGSGYHIIQSKIAVGSGQLFGKGFLEGTQTQLAFLPEHTTDFVFSVLAEEWGFFGSVLVLGLYFNFLFRMLRTVSKSKDLFSALLILGVSGLIFFHMFVNIGMVIGIFPVVGLPLPFFSYGGSAMLSSCFAVGLVLGASMRRMVFSGRL